MPDGATVGAHEAAAARQAERSGQKPKAKRKPSGPPFPRALSYLWGWFRELERGVMGAMTWQDVMAWSQLMRHSPAPWETAVLFRLDLERLRAQNAKPSTPPGLDR